MSQFSNIVGKEGEKEGGKGGTADNLLTFELPNTDTM